MILVDSSAFIEYYRPAGDPAVSAAVAEAIAADRAAVNGIIQVELMPFASSEEDRAKLAADFRAYHWLELGRAEFDLAAALGFDLRRRGTTVPTADLVIAASAIRSRATLYHLDAHFESIARHHELDAVRPGDVS